MKNIILKRFEHLLYESKNEGDNVVLTLQEGKLKKGDRTSWTVSKKDFNKYKSKVDGKTVLDIHEIINKEPDPEIKRRTAYRNLITRDMIDAYITYTIEGNAEKASEIAESIKKIKSIVRQNIPEE